MEENKKDSKNNVKIMAQTALIIAVIIAGAILLRGSKMPETAPVAENTAGTAVSANPSFPGVQVDPVSASDETQGSPDAKVTVIVYADYQCPFCERFFNDAEKTIADKYIPTGKVRFVYRDYSILGIESTRAAEAAHCAGDQGKFWQYHDYLFGHQGKENSGAFSDANLKSFAINLGLDSSAFNKCLDSNKYEQAVADSYAGGNRAMPTPADRYTPKGFILKDGKLFDVILGAQPSSTVSAQIDAALK